MIMKEDLQQAAIKSKTCEVRMSDSEENSKMQNRNAKARKRKLSTTTRKDLHQEPVTNSKSLEDNWIKLNENFKMPNRDLKVRRRKSLMIIKANLN